MAVVANDKGDRVGGGLRPQADAGGLSVPDSVLKVVRRISLACGILFAILGVVWFFYAVRDYMDEYHARGESMNRAFDADDPHRDVLFLVSYDDDHPTVTFEREGVLEGFKGVDATVEVEYLRTKVYPLGTPGSDAVLDALAVKLAEHEPYDAIVVADDDALHVVEKHHDDMFGGAPVVFLGINDLDYAREMVKTGWATGIIETNYFSEMLELAGKLQPQATHVLTIGDDTTTGRGDLAQFEECKKEFPGYTFETLNLGDMTYVEVCERLEQVDDKTIVLSIDSFVDAEGKTLSVVDAAKLFSEHCPAPIYRGNVGGVGSGFCGTAYCDFVDAGKKAAQMAIDIMSGTSPSKIPLETNVTRCFMFDAQKMEEFGISSSQLPEGTVIVNAKAETTHDLFGPVATPVLMIVVSMSAFLIYAFIGYHLSVRDAKALRKSRNELDFELMHDHLTGLPNRRAFGKYVTGVHGERLRAMIEADLDGFANINDSYGTEAGDAVIAEYARRLRSVPANMLARAGGDEFVLLFDKPLTRDSEILEQVREIFSMPVAWKDTLLDVGASMGIVLDVGDGDYHELVRHANLAIQQAKRDEGAHNLRFYEPYMSEEFERDADIMEHLTNALGTDGLLMLYQPQVSARDGSVYGYEALARLADGSYGPAQFIAVAEKSGLIADVGRLISKMVVEQLASWYAQGLPHRVVSINYSVGQLRDTGYCNYLRGLLERNNVPASSIKIEITESMMISDTQSAHELVENLKAMGIKIAIDDYGTGYSSLERLSYDTIDFVKLDKSIADSFLVPGRESVVKNIAQLAHDLDKYLVMEGVETKEQLDICAEVGCDFIQGYYFARPLPPDEVLGWSPH